MVPDRKISFYKRRVEGVVQDKSRKISGLDSRREGAVYR